MENGDIQKGVPQPGSQENSNSFYHSLRRATYDNTRLGDLLFRKPFNEQLPPYECEVVGKDEYSITVQMQSKTVDTILVEEKSAFDKNNYYHYDREAELKVKNLRTFFSLKNLKDSKRINLDSIKAHGVTISLVGLLLISIMQPMNFLLTMGLMYNFYLFTKKYELL